MLTCCQPVDSEDELQYLLSKPRTGHRWVKPAHLFSVHSAPSNAPLLPRCLLLEPTPAALLYEDTSHRSTQPSHPEHWPPALSTGQWHCISSHQATLSRALECRPVQQKQNTDHHLIHPHFFQKMAKWTHPRSHPALPCR